MAKSKDFTQVGTDRVTLEQALPDRLEDARVLLQQGRWASSIVYHLYAFEILLKVRICQRLDLAGLPVGFQLHEFDALLVLTGLQSRVASLTAAGPVKYSWDQLLGMSPRHLNELRSHPDNPANQPEAQDVFECLNDPVRGIIPWLNLIP